MPTAWQDPTIATPGLPTAAAQRRLFATGTVARPRVNASFTPVVDGQYVSFAAVDGEGWDEAAHVWDFGDGEQSEDGQPQHQYDEPGIYTVVHTAVVPLGDEPDQAALDVVVE